MWLANLIFAGSLWAAGTMQLGGDVVSFDDKTLQVSDGQYIYVLDKNAIRNRSALDKHLKVGQGVEVTVDFNGVLETRELHKKK